MNNKIIAKINEICERCDEIDEAPYGYIQWQKEMNHDVEITLRALFLIELSGFIECLSELDGDISIQEASFISEYKGYDVTIDTIHRNIVQYNSTYSFLEEVPLSFEMFVRADNGIYDEEGLNDSLLSKDLFDIYKSLGSEFISCDGVISDVEVQKLNAFLNILEDYMNNKLKCRNTSNEDDVQELLEDDEDCVQESEIEDKDKLQELLSELNALTGLYDVKKDLQSLINLLQISKIREERGMKKIPISLHMVFSGNPGTGKTTVARLLAKIYCELGVLSSGHLVEVDRSGLVGGYVGQTAIKVQEVIQKSLGGILFIDEAYSLTANKNENDFGYEAVDTLLKGMEDHRDDLVVIVAGYPDLMEEFLQSNPGLRSRFNKFINFKDYNPDELVDIFKGLCIKSGYRATDDCLDYIKEYFENRYEQRDSNFANGREVRNFFETVMVNQANRLASDTDLTNEELEEFTIDDVMDISID